MWTCRMFAAIAIAAMLGLGMSSPRQALAQASCDADRYYVGGSVRAPGGRPIPVRARLSGNLLTKTADDREEACRDAVNEALRHLRPVFTNRLMEQALCEQATRADGSSAPLPSGDIYVRATSLVVEASAEPDIHALAGLSGIEISCQEAQNNTFGSEGAFCNEFVDVTKPFRNVFRNLGCISATATAPGQARVPTPHRSGQDWFDYCIQQGRGAAFELARSTVDKAHQCMIDKQAALIDRNDSRDLVRRVAAYCSRYANYNPHLVRFYIELSALLWGWRGGPRDTGETCTIWAPHQRLPVTSLQSRRACMNNDRDASLRSPRSTLLHKVQGTLSAGCGSSEIPRCRWPHKDITSMLRDNRKCYPHIVLGGQWLFPDTVQNP